MRRSTALAAPFVLLLVLSACTGQVVEVRPLHRYSVPYPSFATLDAAARMAYAPAPRASRPAFSRRRLLELGVKPGPSVSIALVRAWALDYYVVKTRKGLIDDRLVWRVTEEGLCLQPSRYNVPCAKAHHESVTLVDAETGEFVVSYTVR
jgi:hypothetical protein